MCVRRKAEMIPLRVQPVRRNSGAENNDNYNNSSTILAPPPTPVTPNATVIDGGPSIMNTIISSQNNNNNGGSGRTGAQTPGASTSNSAVELKSGGSRFHIIKIPNTGPVKRGRWICTDTEDHAPLLTSKTDVVTIHSAGSGGSSGRQSLHGGIILPNDEISFTIGPPNDLLSYAADHDAGSVVIQSQSAQNLPTVSLNQPILTNNNFSTPQINVNTTNNYSQQQQQQQHQYQQQNVVNNLGGRDSAFMPVNGSSPLQSSYQTTRSPNNFPPSSPHHVFSYPQSAGDVDLTDSLLGKILPQQMANDKISVQASSSFDGYVFLFVFFSFLF